MTLNEIGVIAIAAVFACTVLFAVVDTVLPPLMAVCRWLIFIAILRPLIRRNYRQRAAGKAPDRWYWADRLAAGWGHFVDAP